MKKRCLDLLNGKEGIGPPLYHLTESGDAEEAIALLEERSKSDPKAVWMLGLCNEYGVGVEQNWERARGLYKRWRSMKSASKKIGNVLGKAGCSPSGCSTIRVVGLFDMNKMISFMLLSFFTLSLSLLSYSGEDMEYISEAFMIAPWTSLELSGSLFTHVLPMNRTVIVFMN